MRAKESVDKVLLRLSERVRQEIDSRHRFDSHLCCMLSSTALSLVLQKQGIKAAVIEGRVILSRPMPVMPDEPDDLIELVVHHWVEAEGYCLDITADQFEGHVDPPMAAVRIFPVGSDPRYLRHGVAEPRMLAEMANDPMVREAVQAAAGR